MNPSPQKCSGVAAFFDLDGTLVLFPSLERRLFRALLWRRAIPLGNFALWVAEAVRLAPHGVGVVRQANKMYLRGVSAEVTATVAERVVRAASLEFLPEAVERVAWHALQGHRIVLVSGTLGLLAARAARSMEESLARRGVGASIAVCATRLEGIGGRWTGRIVGEPMFGAAKAEAIRLLAERMELHLGACFAYGDSVHDRAMLDCVGHAMAVNASPAMRRVAMREGWRVVEWHGVRSRAHSDPRNEMRGDARRREKWRPWDERGTACVSERRNSLAAAIVDGRRCAHRNSRFAAT